MGCLVLLLLVAVATHCMLAQAKPSKSLLEDIRDVLQEVRGGSARLTCGKNKFSNSESGITKIDLFPKPDTVKRSSSDRAQLLRLLRDYVEMDDRVFGGVQAKRGEFPWMVFLLLGPYRCGGSILSPTMVLTAAHCVVMSSPGDGACETYDPVNITVFAQEYNWEEADGDMYTVKSVFLHPNVHCEEGSVPLPDFAILELNDPITFNENVQPICLPPYGAPVPYGAKCISAGWGLNPASDTGILNWIRLDVMNPVLCDRMIGATLKDRFCTISLAKVGDVCQGDSGGPLMCKAANGRYYIYGVVSAGSPCWFTATPGLYSSVPYVRNWIRATMLGWNH